MFKDKSDKKGFHLNRDGNATFIGSGSIFKGDLQCHALRIDGQFLGAINSDGDIEISSSGKVSGSLIKGRNIIIHGEVKANIMAEGFLRIHSKAYVEGDIHAQALDIEAGARFVGYSHTGDTQGLKTLTTTDNTTSIEAKSEEDKESKK